ncbi:MAG: hypothetical protein AAGF26_12135, partial [Cyanobacteria bacterium P01_G01_bin.49]
ILNKIETDAIGIIRSMAFSPDEKMLAIGGENGEIELWKIQKNPTLLLTIEQSNSPITSLSFTPDSQSLVAGDSYGNLRVWSLNLDNLLKQGCHWLKDYWKSDISIQGILPICQSMITPTAK